jgi:hypothetical protein
MVSPIGIAFVLTFLLGVVDYFSEGVLATRDGKFKEVFVSFVAGLSVTYIFLHLFPQVYSGAQDYPRLIFLFMLFGFVFYHVAEKWVYQHAPRDKLRKEIEEQHAATLFFYHFLIGLVLVSLIQESLISGLLYFIPVSLHVIINVLPHSHKFRRWYIKAFFTGAPLFGVLVASLVDIPNVVNFGLLGVLAGLLLFLEAREVIPHKREGSVLFFLLGVIVYWALITSLWIF